MNQLAFEQLKEKTRDILKTLPDGAYEFELRLQTLALQLLAQGEPVTPEKLSEVWEMPLEQVKMVFDQARSRGTLELDEDGNMVGTAISLVPTNHIFQVNRKSMYAWCAYDTVYAASVIGERATIDTVDPYSNESIRIIISSEGAIKSNPKDVLATYVGMEADVSGGGQSPRCSQIQFFTSEENARLWSSNHKDISIMTMEQLLEMVKEFQVEPARKMGFL